MIAETLREKKDRLRATQLILNPLAIEVDECLTRRKPLTPSAYKKLVALSGSQELETQMNALEALQSQTDEELIACWVELARDNYHDFYEFMNRNEGEDEQGYIMSPHQRMIGDLLMGSLNKEIMRFMLSMPPGHCKSTHSSHHFPAYWLGKNPRRIFLQAGHGQQFVSNELGAKAKSIVSSDDFKLVFPTIQIANDMRAKDYWALTNKKGKYVGRGAGQGISGFRGHYGMVDDPYASRKDAESPVVRADVFKWYSDDFSTRLLPGSPLGIIMTRWHSDDICGRITDREARDKKDREEKAEKDFLEKMEENEGGSSKYRFQIFNLPAIAEDADDPLGRAVGEPLWPEVYDLAALENLRADMTAPSWNSLYQGTPMDISGGTVTAEWFRRYDALPARANVETGTPSEIRRIVVSVDAANTAKERSDFTVIQVWIEDLNKRHYLADTFRKQVEFVELCVEIDKMVARWEKIAGRVDALLVEAKGNGLAYIQLKENGGAPAPMIAIEPGTNSKEFRFDEVSPMFEAGQIYLPHKASWLPDFEKELVAFPAGKNDDQVDACSQYLKWAKQKGRRGSKKLSGSGYK